jgi:hypothetical protein
MRRLPLLIVICSLAAAAPASAQVSAAATPNKAGKASAVHFVIAGSEAPISSRIPSALTLTVPPGFTLDRTAAPARCSHTRALLDECPAASEIGTATLTITVLYQGHPPRDVTFHLRMYMRSRTSVLGVTFLAGTRVVPGSLNSSAGIAVRFDPLPAPPVFQQVSYLLKEIRLHLGVTHRVRVVVGRRRAHKHSPPKRTSVLRSLLHNPTSCASGSWPASVSLGFPDNSSLVLPAPIACTP